MEIAKLVWYGYAKTNNVLKMVKTLAKRNINKNYLSRGLNNSLLYYIVNTFSKPRIFNVLAQAQNINNN